MSGLEIVLAVAALVAGLTGTWSPCGFSMIETIGPTGHSGGRATTLSACVTFTIGALVGGVLTFGVLSVLGEAVHGAGQELAYVVAAVIALVAAVAELRGVPILPQLRRQLPEHWRRLMPMPIAAGLYGVLLGLGFTTFVLTFGVFALAGIVFAVGEPAIGIAVGLAFGIGRALPIALVAPVADRERGIAITEAMAERPALYRLARAGDGLALVAAAAALLVAVPAEAAQTGPKPAADPSISGKTLVYQRPSGAAYIRGAEGNQRLPGTDPAIGGGRIALIVGAEIHVLSAADLATISVIPAAGVDAIAISRSWVVWRSHQNGRDFMRARKLTNPAAPGPELSLGTAGRRAQLGRPSVDGRRLVYARAQQTENVIVKRVLGKSAKTAVLRSRALGLSNPSIHGGKLLYVLGTRRGDRLKLKSVGGKGHGRTLLSRPRGQLWSTALGANRAYVTVISGTKPRQKIVSVPR
jgi:hypothetical protein